MVSLDDEWSDPGPDVGPASASAGTGSTGGYGRVRGKIVGRAM